ncbi:uncharacterized protein TNCV_4052761 [Trichonephila clavipes]|nr:uncharacterized protein TNCV_4052761 [Trichonephila clavipes]
MTTTYYRVRVAVGVCHLFSVEALLCCPVASWCTRNDDNDILPQPLGGGCSSIFSVEALLCCPVASWCTRNDDNDILPRTALVVGFSHLFSVEALLCGPVASWCTRNDDNDILPQPFGGGCSSIFSVEALLCCPVASWFTRNDDNDILPQPWRWVFVTFFPSRHYSAVRSRLGARGTMTTTSYRSRSGGGCSSPFSVEALLCCPVASWCTRNDDNDILPRRAAVGVRHLFFVEALLCCPVASWCTRNDDNDILPQPFVGGCSSPFFRRGTTLLSGRVLVHAER